jgi:hypothetical protein
MEMPASPDGQQPPPNSTPAAPATPPAQQTAPATPPAPPKDPYEQYRGVEIRDYADAKRNIDRRIELENETRELRKQIDEHKGSSAALLEKVSSMERAGRRREIEDSILQGAHPEHADMLRLMLPGLHESKELDLYADDTKEAGKKAREKLAKRFPSYFRAPDGATSAGQPTPPPRSYAGVKAWTDLTPEQQSSMSAEDFKQVFGSGAGGKGAGVVVTRR